MSTALHDKAMLASPSISLPGFTRKDEDITADVKLKHALGKEAGKWISQVFPEPATRPFIKFKSAVTKVHERLTLSYPERGVAILPSALYLEYVEEMGKLKQQFFALRDEFMSHLSEHEAWAKKEHNGHFDASLYRREELVKKFGFNVGFRPVPASSQFSSTIHSLIGNEAASDVDAAVQLAAQEAQKELLERLSKPLGHIVSKLSDDEAVFRDTIISNLREIVDLVPQLNLAGDAGLNKFAAEAKRELSNLDPQVLRDNKSARREAAQKADALAKKMQAYLSP